MQFNKKLYELRKQKGLSQEELAGKINVSRQTLSKWELGESTPDMEKLILLSDYFGVSLDELVFAERAVNGTNQGDTGASGVGRIRDVRLTGEQRRGMKKILKVIVFILLALLCADLVSLIMYLALYGFPN